MLLVKTKIGPSDIAGIGLYADQFIPRGTRVWAFEPKLDLLLSSEEVNELSGPARQQFLNYAYLDKVRQKYLLCGDDARFFNHSTNPNCDEAADNDATYALRDIASGEELSINYKDFYGDLVDHPEIG